MLWLEWRARAQSVAAAVAAQRALALLPKHTTKKQQAECKARGVDAYVVAADVCSNAAQERAFDEHMRR